MLALPFVPPLPSEPLTRSNARTHAMVLALTCAVQNYDWGITGASEVSALGALNTGTASEVAKPYAELWMGTHPSGPSTVKDTGVGLRETIAADATTHLGAETHGRFGDDLPFLTKVLSVAKALSIQAHPDKALAAQLHADRPNVYKDANHKPEMTLAISEFEALCAFVAPAELAGHLGTVPELRNVVGDEVAAAFTAAVAAAGADTPKAELRAVFTALMTADADAVAAQVDALAARLSAAAAESLTRVDALALRLNSQYPQDVGVLCAYVLNYVTLKPGQCIYLAANEPHAYLSGECVECMATSDNVVRAGLTPKLRDTAILCDMLTYAAGQPTVLEGEALDAVTRRYQPPFDEFQLEVLEVKPGEKYAVEASPGPCVFLVQAGGGAMGEVAVSRGAVVYAPAGEAVEVSAGEKGCKMYRAMINSRVFA